MTKHRDNEGWDELAGVLGFTTRQLSRWKKLPGAPAEADAEAWAAFLDANGLGKDRGNPTLNDLKAELYRRDIRLRDLKIAKEEGATIPVADVREFLGQLAARHAQLLRMKYDTELPAKLAGQDIVTARRIIAATTDDVGETVNRGLLEWTPNS